MQQWGAKNAPLILETPQLYKHLCGEDREVTGNLSHAFNSPHVVVVGILECCAALVCLDVGPAVAPEGIPTSSSFLHSAIIAHALR